MTQNYNCGGFAILVATASGRHNSCIITVYIVYICVIWYWYNCCICLYPELYHLGTCWRLQVLSLNSISSVQLFLELDKIQQWNNDSEMKINVHLQAQALLILKTACWNIVPSASFHHQPLMTHLPDKWKLSREFWMKCTGSLRTGRHFIKKNPATWISLYVNRRWLYY